jgi:hypothetical protein
MQESTGRRKVVQILSDDEAIIALCDDGTIWEAMPDPDSGAWRWAAVVPLPPGC